MNKRKSPQRALYYWMPVLFWAGLIFYLSGISALSSGLSTPVEIILRKIAHAFEYGVLAVLLLLLVYRGYFLSLSRSFSIALMATLLYALSDELHQTFVLGRNGNLKDVAVDLAGAYIVLKVAYLFFRKKLESKEMAKIAVALVIFILITFWQVWGSLERQEEELRMEAARESLAQEIKKQKENRTIEGEAEPAATAQQKGQQEKSELAGPADVLPEKILLDVPFSSQAPYGVWDEVHEEACEEMSLIMVKFFLDGKALSKEKAEDEILKLKDFQEKKYGHYKDSSMEEVVEIGQEFYGIKNFQVIYNFDKEALKQQLAKGKPVIVPTAGRMLGNPNFTPPGPLYHNLVLTGYEGNTIITNDPGTRKGEGYTYPVDTLYSAIHDYEGSKEKIQQGRKAMIILE